MPVPPHHFDDDPVDAPVPGGLLGELERRQEDVLNQLDDLDAKLAEVLKDLEPASGNPSEVTGGGRFLSEPNESLFESIDDIGLDEDEADASESAEDWA